MTTDEHYLKNELYHLVKNDSMIFDFIQHGSLDGIWYWDLEKPEHEWMSPRFWEIFGYDPQEMKHFASEWQDLIDPDDLKEAVTNLTEHCKNPNHKYDQIVRYRHKSGSTVWVRCRGIAIRNAQGKPVRMLGAHTDLTSLKQTELELLESKQKLEEAQHIAKMGSWMYYIDENRLEWSDEVYRIFEIKPENFNGTLDAVLERIHPDERELVIVNYQILIKEKKPYILDHRILLPDGRIKHLHERCHTIYNDDGVATYSVGTVQDVTDRVLAEKQRIKLETQLHQKRKMESIGYMAGGVAHNFNNFLSVILGNIDLISMLNNFDESTRAKLDNVVDVSLRARDLVQKVITYSQKEIQNKSATRLQDIIGKVTAQVTPTLPPAIRLQRKIDLAPEVLVDADASQLIKALSDLYQNAIEALDGQGELTISLDSVELTASDIPAQYEVEAGRYVRLQVQDNGCGIPKEQLSQIFDPFFSTKGSHDVVGMGLATVQGIVRQHGGLITVISSPGTGSTFSLFFPQLANADRTKEKLSFPSI